MKNYRGDTVYHITYGDGPKHAERLKRGLAALGPNFLAFLCWWCDGTGNHKFECCNVCGKGKQYGASLGLLTGHNMPAPESVVNQVLVAAGPDSEPLAPPPTT